MKNLVNTVNKTKATANWAKQCEYDFLPQM